MARRDIGNVILKWIFVGCHLWYVLAEPIDGLLIALLCRTLAQLSCSMTFQTDFCIQSSHFLEFDHFWKVVLELCSCTALSVPGWKMKCLCICPQLCKTISFLFWAGLVLCCLFSLFCKAAITSQKSELGRLMAHNVLALEASSMRSLSF